MLRKIATALSVKAVLPDAIKVSGVAINQAQNKIGDGDDDALEAHALLDRFYKEHSKFFWKQLTTLTADTGPYDVTFVGTIGEYKESDISRKNHPEGDGSCNYFHL